MNTDDMNDIVLRGLTTLNEQEAGDLLTEMETDLPIIGALETFVAEVAIGVYKYEELRLKALLALQRHRECNDTTKGEIDEQ